MMHPKLKIINSAYIHNTTAFLVGSDIFAQRCDTFPTMQQHY